MIPYWLLFSFFALGAVLEADRSARKPGSRNPLFLVGALIVIAMVGLRHEVGADWFNYKHMFSVAGRSDLWRALSLGDPGYQLINWLVYQLGGEVWLVNLISGAVLSWGLFRLARTQPRPWLVVLVAVPYLIIVVAMGYTRQSVALGVLMAGIAAFLNGSSTLKFAAYIAAAALFHRTVVVAFPLVALASERNQFINLLFTAVATFLLYDMFLSAEVSGFVERYIETEYSSQGAAIRIAMNMVAALVFWFGSRRAGFGDRERGVWRNFAIAAAVLAILLFIIPSSTAVDRMALYILPLQLAVLARVPLIIDQFLGKALTIAYLLTVQFVWLNFAQHSDHWVPYRWVFG